MHGNELSALNYPNDGDEADGSTQAYMDTGSVQALCKRNGGLDICCESHAFLHDLVLQTDNYLIRCL